MISHRLAFALIAASTTLLACSDSASSPPEAAVAVPPTETTEPAPDAGRSPPPATAAKDAGADGAMPSATKPANAPWVVGTFDWSEWQAGDLHADFLNLPMDGSGYETTQILRPLIPYNAGDEVDTTYFQWTSDGSTIHAGQKDFTITAKTPNCRLVLMGGHVYTHPPSTGTCPVQMPALTDLEKARVGFWEYYDPATTSYSDAYIRIELDADRYLHVEYQPHVIYYDDPSTHQQAWTDYYLTEPDGTLHGTNPSGVEEFTQPLLDAGNGALEICDDQNNCNVLTKKN